VLREVCKHRKWPNNIFEKWMDEERVYLEGLRREPEEDTLRCLYVEAIEQYWERFAKEKQQEDAVGTVDAALNRRVDPTKRKSKRTLRAIYDETDIFLKRCAHLETELGIDRWLDSTSPDYIEARKYYDTRKYHLALDKVESLVIQRLMELHKCNIRGTNYKTRTSIFKHMKSRSNTIRSAIASYNAFARRLGRPTLDFKKTMEYSFIAEFDLLRIGRTDIRAEPWSNPHNRALRDSYFRVIRAREEIKRLHLEMDRMHAWMRQERSDHETAVTELKETEPDLASELVTVYAEQLRVHHVIRYWLAKCQDLDGFAGTVVMLTNIELPVNMQDDIAADECEPDEDVAAAVFDLEEALIRVERLG